MVLYIPQQAVEAVNDLLSKLPDDREEGEFLLTVTNNNNGVSVDKTFPRWRRCATHSPRLMR